MSDCRFDLVTKVPSNQESGASENKLGQNSSRPGLSGRTEKSTNDIKPHEVVFSCYENIEE
jgi:hypothetical protein